MYESPITMIVNDMCTKIVEHKEDRIMYEISQALNTNIDKAELIRALNYDREQYKKGYSDAERKYKEKWYKLYNYLNDYRLAVAPDESTPDYEKKYKQVVTDTIDSIMKTMEVLEDSDESTYNDNK